MKTKIKLLTLALSLLLAASSLAACGEKAGEQEDVYYTVTYALDGGTMEAAQSEKVKKGESVTLPSPVKTGSIFGGWYEGETSVGLAGEKYTPTKDVTLTAKWSVDPVSLYGKENLDRAIEYAKIIRENYWNSDTHLSSLTPEGGAPYLWPYTEQVSMVNGILLCIDESHPDYDYFTEYLEELIVGLRHYRVKEVRVGSGQSWENADHVLAPFGVNDGTPNSYAIYNSGRNGSAIDSVFAGMDGVFFDDNIWVAKEFYYAYVNLGKAEYFNEAMNIVNWIVGEGYEETKGLNGIYWRWSAKFLFENKAGGGLDDNNHASLNACSSAPTAMMLVKLAAQMDNEEFGGKFDSQKEDFILKAQNIYEFCYSELLNPATNCLRDKIFLAEGFEDMSNKDQQIQLVDAQELPYNTGTFMTAGAELYNWFKEETPLLADIYHERNFEVAAGADKKFANGAVLEGQYAYNTNSWFTSFLLEGFMDLADADENCAEYIEHMRSSLDYAWKNNRSQDGLVSPAWIEGWSHFNDSNPNSEGNPRQILLQSANAHCYAMLARYFA